MARDNYYDTFKKNKSPRLKKCRHYFEVAVVNGIKNFARSFSVPMNQLMGKNVGRFIGKFLKKDWGIANYQLEFCFPEKNAQEIDQLISDMFAHFGQNLMEALVINKFRENPERWIKFEGLEVIEELKQKDTGAIFLFGHFGNWELMPIVYEMLGIKGKAIGRSVDAKGLDKLVQETRKSDNLLIIPRGDSKSGRLMLQCLKNKEVLLLGIDQDTKAQSYFVDFFARKAKTPKVVASFASKFSVPVIAAFGARNPDGTHTFYFEKLSEPPHEKGEETELELTQRYSNAMEAHVRRFPEQWAWFHRRWKTQPDDPKNEEDEVFDLGEEDQPEEKSLEN